MKTIEQLTQELEAANIHVNELMEHSRSLNHKMVHWYDEHNRVYKELEQVKKERDEAIKTTVKYIQDRDKQIFLVMAQRDEANDILKAIQWHLSEGRHIQDGSVIHKDVDKHLSRLSSGETKPERCRECDNGYTTRQGIDFSCQHCNGSGFITPTNPANEQETNQPEIPESSPTSPWISVEDRLPEVHKEYDVALNNGKTGIGIYHTSKVWIAKGYSWDFLKSKERVTHFMERLPAPQESLTDKNT